MTVSLIVGQSGSGKTAYEIRRLQTIPISIFLDGNSNYNGCDNFNNFRIKPGINVLHIRNSDNVTFNHLVNYLFNLYQVHNYKYMIDFTIDEAHLYTSTCADDMDRLATTSRRFFNCTFMTQKPSLLLTHNKATIFDQSQIITMFYVYRNNFDKVRDWTGIPFAESDYAWIDTATNGNIKHRYIRYKDAVISKYNPLNI